MDQQNQEDTLELENVTERQNYEDYHYPQRPSAALLIKTGKQTESGETIWKSQRC